MSVTTDLTRQLRAEVLRLEDDLRVRLGQLAERDAEWRAQHKQATAKQRTAESWEGWRDERITQVAVAWVLTTVFVRFCEDNALVAPVWITGPAGRRQEAIDAQLQFLRETAQTERDVTDREWLLQAFSYLHGLKATANLVDDTSPLWLLSPSGDAATRLLDFWRERDNDGNPLRELGDAQLDTRFLGDVYQDLSAEAKKRYALLQTPVFVEEFILDRTLEPALAERPLEGFKLIDPTCGSGHFLLGALARFLDRWHRQAPGMNERERVQKALDSIYGVDINPFAVAIARFRLTVAALRASGLTRLEDASAFDYHLAAGDSLLHGSGQATLAEDSDLDDFAYETEDLTELKSILASHQYDVVVGNPPYITVKDKALNAAYRLRYRTCSGKFALTVPFMERFFGLARNGDHAGWVGQITSNSFMKREFGVPLIEKFLPTKDLQLVADTSGAYIPGHGTPTVIIVGRSQRATTATVRSVLGVRGEPGRPSDPAKGTVWSTIVDHVDEPGYSDGWITVADLDRGHLRTHPWSLSGGGAVELLAAVESVTVRKLRDIASEIGIVAVLGEEEAFELPPGSREPSIPVVTGDLVRDFQLDTTPRFWPYDDELRVTEIARTSHSMWRSRRVVSGYLMFGKTRAQRGLPWMAYGMLAVPKLRTPLSIAFAFVATHNHFVFDRGGKVFKQSAPVIKLPEGAREDDHFALLGVLNSSVACFWLKQNSHDKGNGGIGGGIASEEWERFYEFTGTTLQDFPLPSQLPTELGSRLNSLAHRAGASDPSADFEGTPSREELDRRRWVYPARRQQMIFEQEELDWLTYSLYGLVDQDLTFHRQDTLQSIDLGQRAFEIVLARRIAAGEEESAWFARHGSTPITELPRNWPDNYRDLVERRLRLIETNPFIRLLERPEYKRRWAGEAWEKKEERALRGWLLDRLEDRRFWFERQDRPAAMSVQQLADHVSRDDNLTSVLALWEGRPDVPVVDSLAKLLSTEAVPYLAAYRYREPGLRKRAAWENTWALQRQEDAGEKIDGPIPVPPKYTTADFTRAEYWSHRGKLDVPKERFTLYPNAGRDTDPTPLLGWAGWDHAQQSLALAGLIQQRANDGWADERLVPLVAGLAELMPWVQQWHSQPDEAYGGASPAEFFADQLEQRTAQVGRTVEQLSAWRPEPVGRGRRRKSTP